LNSLSLAPVIMESAPIVMLASPKRRTFFKTLSGASIPCITTEERAEIMRLSLQRGMSADQIIENMARNLSTLILQKNAATVILVVSKTIQGASALATARHLLNHGVKVSANISNYGDVDVSFFFFPLV
jgi:hypothetical protein